MTMPSLGICAGSLLFLLGLVGLRLGRKRGEDQGAAVGGKRQRHAARRRRRPFFGNRGLVGCGTRAGGFVLVLAGDQVADDDFAVAILRKDAVGQKLAVVGQALTGNGLPTVVIAVV